METNYSEYTVNVSSDPSYYGDNVSTEQGIEIADKIAALIETQFPGITVRRWDGIGNAGTTGPDSNTITEIDTWVSENWSASL